MPAEVAPPAEVLHAHQRSLEACLPVPAEVASSAEVAHFLAVPVEVASPEERPCLPVPAELFQCEEGPGNNNVHTTFTFTFTLCTSHVRNDNRFHIMYLLIVSGKTKAKKI